MIDAPKPLIHMQITLSTNGEVRMESNHGDNRILALGMLEFAKIALTSVKEPSTIQVARALS